MFFLVRFFSKNKVFARPKVVLYQNICKNLIWRGQIFVFLIVILKFSFRFIAHLKKKKLSFVNILSSLVFCNLVRLGAHVQNVFRKVFSKLLFDQWLKNQLLAFFLWEFYIHSTDVRSHFLKNNFNAFL